MSIQHIDDNGTLSEATIYGDTIYLAGQVPDDDSLDITGQTQQVLANIDKLLLATGSHKGQMLSAQVFIKNLSDFPAFNDVWKAWLSGHPTPARATIEANLVNPKWLIEIMVVAKK